MAKSILSQEYLKSILHYNPQTGVFTWLAGNNQVKAGGIAGHMPPTGYVVIGHQRQSHLAHRLAWLYMTGAYPKKPLDHRNGIRSDNRFENLREANQSQNMQNRHSAKTGKKGLLGAFPCRNKWKAIIKSQGKYIYLGVFETNEEAHEAYLSEKRKLHEFCEI